MALFVFRRRSKLRYIQHKSYGHKQEQMPQVGLDMGAHLVSFAVFMSLIASRCRGGGLKCLSHARGPRVVVHKAKRNETLVL